MSLPSLEKRRVKVSKGELPSPYLSNLASCRPFTKQIDVVFPSDGGLLDALNGVESLYVNGKTTLSEIYENAESFVVGGTSRILILSNDSYGEDCWCVDDRGVVSLCVGKEVYERCGVVGRRMVFKGFEDRYVIEIDLKKSAYTVGQQKRFREAVKAVDLLRRESLGSDNADWDVLACSIDPSVELHQINLFRQQSPVKLASRVREMKDVHIPSSVLFDVGSQSTMNVDDQEEADEDVRENTTRRMEELFEWTGMACLGSQRLYANDRVDPYVALYEPPEPSVVGSLTHMRWTGLLSPKFVELVVQRIVDSTSPNFVSITALAYTNSPVSYITRPAKGSSGKGTAVPKVPLRLPKKDGEDTWSLVVESRKKSDAESGVERRWCLVECLGQWDARWG